MTRLRTLTLIAVFAALAAVFAACGGSSSSQSNENPQKVVDGATLKGVKSGKLDLALAAKVHGSEGGNIDIGVNGPFQSQGKGELPQVDLDISVNGDINGQSVDFDGGLTATEDSAFVNYSGTDYEVDPATFSFLKTMFDQAQQGGGSGNKACQQVAGRYTAKDFVGNLTNEGSSDVDGTATTHVSGDLDVGKSLDTLAAIASDPACRNLDSSSQLPSPAELKQHRSEIVNAVKSAHVDLYVGDDHIIRRAVVDLDVKPPADSGSGADEVELKVNMTLSDVNEPQDISAPDNTKPLNELLQKLGIDPSSLQALGGLGGISGLGGLGGLSGGAGSGAGSGGGGGATPSLPSQEKQQAYLKCLQSAQSPVDLQKCAAMLQR